MEKMIGYEILDEGDVSRFEDGVQKYLKLHWQPHGPLVVTYLGERELPGGQSKHIFRYIQAMVLYAPVMKAGQAGSFSGEG
jgi:hypothetical protein